MACKGSMTLFKCGNSWRRGHWMRRVHEGSGGCATCVVDLSVTNAGHDGVDDRAFRSAVRQNASNPASLLASVVGKLPRMHLILTRPD